MFESTDQLPPNWFVLSGKHATHGRLDVTEKLLHTVAVLAYPLPASGERRFGTLRLSVAGWTESPKNMRHGLAINRELADLAVAKNVVLDPAQPFEASRNLIATINGVDANEHAGEAVSAHEAKVLRRDQELRQAQSENRFNGMINELLTQAVKFGTADIHIYVRYDKDKKTQRNRSLIEFRIDGDIETVDDLPPAMKDPAELRGMIGYMYNEQCSNRSETSFNPGNFLEATLNDRVVGTRGETIRGRFTTFDLGDAPAPNGDRPFKLVLRIIYVDRVEIPTLEALGFFPDVIAAVDRFTSNNKRLLSISGSVNMGKSTTLRSVFANVGGAKYSAEDPIENTHPNTAQINVSGAEAMERALLRFKRGDLNTLLMGEVRDRQTLEMAVNVVLSGHPVYTTTHSDSALAQIAYFLSSKMGMQADLLAHSAVLGLLMHQVLVRKLCTCALRGGRAMETLGLQRLRHIEKTYHVDVDRFHAHNPDGCEICRAQGHASRVGYMGRKILAEYFEPDTDDRVLIGKRDFLGLERRWRESHGAFDDLTNTRGHTALEVGLKAALQGGIDLRSIERYCGRFEDAVVVNSPSFVPAAKPVIGSGVIANLPESQRA
ncbi:ATPase, T2SS/T4P/T4SS family [Massilia orientalis]|uniref:ATPase, T2SS/T4P/T4SS family n=1 Tax=Massilia orientalis TaxID=3050128 RepID=UPI0025CAB52B|nr:ATPase, T2SS/T4P/T4SS family [Massilia sp. YIM B02787]